MNFFVTGDDSFKTNIYLNSVTPAGSHGANFSVEGQSLSQSFSIAQDIFTRVTRGKIDFVIIGLAPDCLFAGGDIDENLNALNEYLKLCVDSGAKPVTVIFPVAPIVRDRYRQKFVTPLREILAELKKIYDFELVDLFDVPLPEECMTDKTHMTLEGSRAVSSILTFELYKRQIISFEKLRRMSYEFFSDLTCYLSGNDFHKFMDKIFQATVDELKRRNKIKIAFVTDHAATWCGDELYNLFASNPRFEPTIFICLAKGDSSISTLRKEISRDVERFKARGLNAVAVFEENDSTPPQDIVIFLRPYYFSLSKNFRFDTLTLQTLAVYIHYASGAVALPLYYNYPIFYLGWKVFFDGEWTRKFFDKNCTIGMPRAYASGLPKMDSLFDTEKFSFPWKMIRPDAKKIIWAPHWTISDKEDVNNYGTFQYNFRLMYEFAKNHPEMSWVVKPHPLLPRAVLEAGLFPSAEAFEDYIQAWNDLPNAQYFTGAYYQEIFATSDGMIQDSNSFIAEYQFTHKPMIFLTRKKQQFTEFGRKILDVSYCIDGRDLDGIIALMQKIFIEGNDPLKDARQKVFDEILDYRRINGMSASEYIYRSIADDLGV